MPPDYRKNYRVTLTHGLHSVVGQGRTMPQAYADAVRQNPGVDWRPVFDQARRVLVRQTLQMHSEIVSDGLVVRIDRPWT